MSDDSKEFITKAEAEEIRAKLRAFEDKHRPAVQAAWAAYKTSIAANWKAHVLTAALGAAALKAYPFVSAIVGKVIA